MVIDYAVSLEACAVLIELSGNAVTEATMLSDFYSLVVTPPSPSHQRALIPRFSPTVSLLMSRHSSRGSTRPPNPILFYLWD